MQTQQRWAGAEFRHFAAAYIPWFGTIPPLPCATTTFPPSETESDKSQGTFLGGKGKGIWDFMHSNVILWGEATSTLESKRNNEELNNLFLPLPLPVLFSWISHGIWQVSFPDGSHWAISPPHVLMGALPCTNTVTTTSRRKIISGLPSQEFYTQIYSLSLSLECRHHTPALHGLNNLESYQVIHPTVEIIPLDVFVRNCMNFGFILVSNQYTLSQD